MRYRDIPETVRMRSDNYLLTVLRFAGWDVRMVAERAGETVEADDVAELFICAMRIGRNEAA